MTGRVIPRGRIAGIPIRLDSSWFLIFALVTWTLAAGYYPAEFKGWPAWEYWVMGAATAAMSFVSVLLHELSHSLVARRFGTSVRSITLFIFGGVSQVGGGTTSATREVLIAAAGPAASLLLAALFWVLESAAVGVAPALALLRYLAYSNAMLGLFNLMPEFPLDDGGVFEQLVDGHVLVHGQRSFLVERDGRVVGLLTLHGITRQPRPSWPTVRAEDVMIPRTKMRTTRRDADLRDVLEHMDRDGVNQLPVIENSHPLGMVS